MSDKTFALLEKLYLEFTAFKDDTNNKFDRLEKEVNDVKKTVLNIENDHRHDEFIMKRIK